MKYIYLLGCTGSIGSQTIEVIRTMKDIKIESMSFGDNIDKAIPLIKEFKPEYICAKTLETSLKIKQLFPDIEVGYGMDGLVKAATYHKDHKGYLLNAIVGMIGLVPTIEAIKINRDILLANKETLVVGGELINKLKEKYTFQLLPIDSEHSAILQSLQGRNTKEVKNIVITASGGAFRDLKREELASVSIKDALDHPSWVMGKKITIDCATMVNKGLEVMEAHYLFNMPYEKIKTILHYESIVHSFVEFVDGSVIAELAKPDMRIPIQYALTYPKKTEFKLDTILDLTKTKPLSFKEMDYERYPLLKLAYEVGEQKGIMPLVYNSSNEEAVKLFIENKIKFLDIEKIIFNLVELYKNKNKEVMDVEDILKTDCEIRTYINNNYMSIIGKE